MGEALMRKHAGDVLTCTARGPIPRGVNPLAIRALSEIGIDASRHRSKHLREYLGKLPVRYLIVVCGDAEESCPRIWPGMQNRLFWPFADPAAATGTDEEKLAEFRRGARRNRCQDTSVAERNRSVTR